MLKHKQLMLMVPGLVKQEGKMDFYQALSPQGVYQTINVARKIKEDPCDNPEFIFSATALYIRQTAEILHHVFPLAEQVFRDNLYTANKENLLHFLSHLDDIFECLLILSEAVPIQKLVAQLTGQKHELLPSACLCICWPLNQSWKTIGQSNGQLTQLWMP